MPSTTYVDFRPPAVNAEWLNEVNDYVFDSGGLATPSGGTQAAMQVLLQSMGYSPFVPYIAGLVMGSTDQTVLYQNAVYAPNLADLPFTTSGAFETAKFHPATLVDETGGAHVGIAQGGTVEDSVSTYVVVPGAAAGRSAADNAAAINAAIVYAAALNLGVDLGGKTLNVGKIRIKNGLKFLRNGKLTPAAKVGSSAQGAIEFDGGSLGGTAVKRCEFDDLEIDLVNDPFAAFYGEGVTYCRFKSGLYIHNGGNTTNSLFGIMLWEGSSYNRIEGAEVLLNPLQSGGVCVDFYAAGVDAYYGYFANATGNITAASAPCIKNHVTGCTLVGGQQGIRVQGCNKNILTGNHIASCLDRAVLMMGANGNVVASNNTEGTSSGIHMAYGCTQNIVNANRVDTRGGGEAGIQAYVGSGGNTITNNTVTGASQMGINIACSSNYNKIWNNSVEGFQICGILLQANWRGSGGLGVYGRPNYSSPPTGATWAFTDLIGNSVKGNYIFESANIGPDCGIALIELRDEAVTYYSLTFSEVVDNKVMSVNLTNNTWVFEEASNKVLNNTLQGNSFSDPTLSKFSGNDTALSPDGYSYAFKMITGNEGINTRQSYTPVIQGSTTAGAGTYTTQKAIWTRIDKSTIMLEVEIVWTAHTGTGGLMLTLPTSVQHIGVGGQSIPSTIHLENIAITAGKWPTALIGAGNDRCNFFEMQSGGGAALLLMSATGVVRLSGVYDYRALT